MIPVSTIFTKNPAHCNMGMGVLGMIRLIIFDLGKVILDFSHLKIAEGLAVCSNHRTYRDPKNIVEHMFNTGSKIASLYEEGKITSNDFFEYIKETFGLDISFLQFKLIWNEIFSENKGIGDLIKRLKEDFTLFLLSNTNELHFEYVKEKFPIVYKFDKWVLSHEAGIRKPHPGIYHMALSGAGVKPEEAIFIDDIAEFVSGAQSIGIHAVEFKSVEQITRYIEEKAYE